MESNKITCKTVALRMSLSLIGIFSLLPSTSWAQNNDADSSSLSPTLAPPPITGQSEINTDAEKESSANMSPNNGFYDRYIKDRLQLGTRSAYRLLTDSDSGAMGKSQGEGTFLGSIFALKEEQNVLPIQPFVTYYFTKYLGLELAYDSFSAKTQAFNGAVKTDGDIDLQGPTLTLLGRYPNQTSLTPYAGIGLGYYYAHFNADPAWALGYNDTAEWASYGYPKTSLDDYYRYMYLDNPLALQLTAGLTWNIYKEWSLDLSAEYVKADVDATFKSYSHGVNFINESGSFPMSNVGLRLGITYTF